MRCLTWFTVIFSFGLMDAFYGRSLDIKDVKQQFRSRFLSRHDGQELDDIVHGLAALRAKVTKKYSKPLRNPLLADLKSHSLKLSTPKEAKTLDNQAWNVNEGLDDFLFDKDILLSPEQIQELIDAEDESTISRTKRQAVAGPKYRLFNSRFPIYYRFNETITPSLREYVRFAANFWNTYTCLNLTEGLGEQQIYIFRGEGCWSTLGKKYGAENELSLGPGCENIGVVAHEFGHALGFHHTHNRFDRDDYITILDYANIGDQFVKTSMTDNDNYMLPYDYPSIMHYSTNRGNPKFVANDQTREFSMGAQHLPTHIDLHMMNLLHGCIDRCPTTPSCQNGGFPNPRKCEECICPQGFGGTICDTIKPSANVPYQCGGILEATPTAQTLSGQVISNGTYSNAQTNVMSECNWHIKAPECKNVKITLTDFKSQACTIPCSYSGVEIKIDRFDRHGARYCCSDNINTSHVFTSTGPLAVVNAFTKFGQLSFNLTYSYIDQIGCVIGQPTTPTTTTRRPTLTPPTIDCSGCPDLVIGSNPPGLLRTNGCSSLTVKSGGIEGCSANFTCRGTDPNGNTTSYHQLVGSWRVATHGKGLQEIQKTFLCKNKTWTYLNSPIDNTVYCVATVPPGQTENICPAIPETSTVPVTTTTTTTTTTEATTTTTKLTTTTTLKPTTTTTKATTTTTKPTTTTTKPTTTTRPTTTTTKPITTTTKPTTTTTKATTTTRPTTTPLPTVPSTTTTKATPPSPPKECPVCEPIKFVKPNKAQACGYVNELDDCRIEILCYGTNPDNTSLTEFYYGSVRHHAYGLEPTRRVYECTEQGWMGTGSVLGPMNASVRCQATLPPGQKEHICPSTLPLQRECPVCSPIKFEEGTLPLACGRTATLGNCQTEVLCYGNNSSLVRLDGTIYNETTETNAYSFANFYYTARRSLECTSEGWKGIKTEADKRYRDTFKCGAKLPEGQETHVCPVPPRPPKKCPVCEPIKFVKATKPPACGYVNQLDDCRVEILCYGTNPANTSVTEFRYGSVMQRAYGLEPTRRVYECTEQGWIGTGNILGRMNATVRCEATLPMGQKEHICPSAMPQQRECPVCSPIKFAEGKLPMVCGRTKALGNCQTEVQCVGRNSTRLDGTYFNGTTELSTSSYGYSNSYFIAKKNLECTSEGWKGVQTEADRIYQDTFACGAIHLPGNENLDCYNL